MKLNTKFITFLMSVGVSTVLFASGVSHAAGSAIFSLNPSLATENIGSTFNVAVYENGNGSAVNTVIANLSYNQSQLQFVSAVCAGDFNAQYITPSGGSGSVSITCATPGGSTAPTDNELAGVITFKALVGSGSSTITFATSSSILAADGHGTPIWNGDTTTSSATYSLATPAPIVTPPSTPVTTSVTPPGSRSTLTSSSNTTPTSTTPSTTSTAGGKVSGASTKKNNTKKLNYRRTAFTTSFYTYFWIIVLLAAAAITSFALAIRRKMVMSGDQGTFVKYILRSTTTKNPSKIKTLAKKFARSSGSKKKTTKK
jgi:hypothetical protein